MNVAMIASGQPRYTKYIFDNFFRIKDAKKIDLYFFMWSNYLLTEDDKNIIDGVGSIEEQLVKGLPKNCTLKKYVISEEPSIEQLFQKYNLDFNYLISKVIGFNSTTSEEVLKRSITNLYLQRYSCMKAFELLDEEYDCIIRYRPDCYTTNDIYLNELDLENNIYAPINLGAGGIIPGVPHMNDKFAIGNMKNMKIYFEAFNHLYENQIENGETIQEETSLAYHLVKNNVNIKREKILHYMVKKETGDGKNCLTKI